LNAGEERRRKDQQKSRTPTESFHNCSREYDIQSKPPWYAGQKCFARLGGCKPPREMTVSGEMAD
jgi:hypothetical protein